MPPPGAFFIGAQRLLLIGAIEPLRDRRNEAS